MTETRRFGLRLDVIETPNQLSDAPQWAARVERWQQIDAAALATAESCHRIRLQPEYVPPAAVVLASSDSSGATDRAFARGGAFSPSKFVHTLPNIRSSVLCQILDWAGPVYCVQAGESTMVRGLEEAMAFVSGGRHRNCWVLTVEACSRSEAQRTLIMRLGNHSPDEAPYSFVAASKTLTAEAPRSILLDQDLADWLTGSPAPHEISLPAGYLLKRRRRE